MLKGLAFRLGFILCLAVVARVGAALFGPDHPKPKLVAMTDRFGNSHMLPAHLASANGGEPVTSEKMRAAIERVRRRDGTGGAGSEARLVFGSGTANPIVTTPSELAAARADLRALELTIAAQTRLVELDEEQREQERERTGGVSFEPGKPMVDPTPRS